MSVTHEEAAAASPRKPQMTPARIRFLTVMGKAETNELYPEVLRLLEHLQIEAQQAVVDPLTADTAAHFSRGRLSMIMDARGALAKVVAEGKQFVGLNPVIHSPTDGVDEQN